jgi:hypothetical protein
VVIAFGPNPSTGGGIGPVPGRDEFDQGSRWNLDETAHAEDRCGPLIGADKFVGERSADTEQACCLRHIQDGRQDRTLMRTARQGVVPRGAPRLLSECDLDLFGYITRGWLSFHDDVPSAGRFFVALHQGQVRKGDGYCHIRGHESVTKDSNRRLAPDHSAPSHPKRSSQKQCRSDASRPSGCRVVTASSGVKWGSSRAWRLAGKTPAPRIRGLCGGAEGIRTPGPLDANEVRYRTAPQPPTSPEDYQPAGQPTPGRVSPGAARPTTAAPSHCPALSRIPPSHCPALSRTAPSHCPTH